MITTDAPPSSSALIVGTAARMRESSTIFPSESGTLKSTRSSTRWPCMFNSRMVRFPEAEMISSAIRRGPLCGGAGRGIGRGLGRADFAAVGATPGLTVAFTLGRFAGRLGAVGGAPVGRG